MCAPICISGATPPGARLRRRPAGARRAAAARTARRVTLPLRIAATARRRSRRRGTSPATIAVSCRSPCRGCSSAITRVRSARPRGRGCRTAAGTAPERGRRRPEEARAARRAARGRRSSREARSGSSAVERGLEVAHAQAAPVRDVRARRRAERARGSGGRARCAPAGRGSICSCSIEHVRRPRGCVVQTRGLACVQEPDACAARHRVHRPPRGRSRELRMRSAQVLEDLRVRDPAVAHRARSRVGDAAARSSAPARTRCSSPGTPRRRAP